MSSSHVRPKYILGVSLLLLLSQLAALEVVITTICSAANADKVGIMTTLMLRVEDIYIYLCFVSWCTLSLGTSVRWQQDKNIQKGWHAWTIIYTYNLLNIYKGFTQRMLMYMSIQIHKISFKCTDFRRHSIQLIIETYSNLIRQYTFLLTFHDDVIKWKHFPRYWSFVREIHRSPVDSPHKGQRRRALMLLWCAP